MRKKQYVQAPDIDLDIYNNGYR